MPEENENQTLESIFSRAQEVRAMDDAKPFVILENQQHVENIELMLNHPTRKTGSPTFTRSDSFCAYVNDQKSDASRLYIPSPNTFVAVLDHHDQSELENPQAGWGQHRATLNLKLTAEWQLWNSKNMAKFDQRNFAQFVDDNSEEILTPAGADLLELVRTVKATASAEYVGEVEEKPSTFSVAYKQGQRATAGNGALELPTELHLGIAVYEGGEPQPITARLRFEIGNGKLSIWYELVKIHKVLQRAIEAEASGIDKATALTGWYGTP